MSSPLLSVRSLARHFRVKRRQGLWQGSATVKAVDDVSFEVGEAETFGLVGESGCGKTTTSRMVLRLERPDGGEIRFAGADVHALRGQALFGYRLAVQAVFQDPYSSLSPRMRVRNIITEPMDAGGRLAPRARADEARRLLGLVGLRPDAADLYPHEFSGGQRQRIAIARALSTNPRLIVLDEPVSALDISIRAQIMNLLRDIQDRSGVSFLLIAHDLAVVRHMSRRVGVMYLGKLVEMADSDELYVRPLHPYTKALLAAGAPIHPAERDRETILSGEMPSPLNPPSGCAFRMRCPMAMARCGEAAPPLKSHAGRFVACHLYDDRPPDAG
ncbi:oligopeptide/dipeptide ABC transporter ATP-binding protein [Vineibacter terrae]|uniref:ABC transporter ATP-binding protein n=1 Tax=Vineibacter terrae TaxID=2586908 RepID=UPI002E308A96|nr:oligopeptide/dipeptide ABC transporter ATP-binding protein [Vineibacter terrae]HEX2890665.1 oligopeptide/dipeptide ABC transporter ATP-binding protein [Vineibacter terrae]